jgi:hypothetical protein
MPEDAREAIGHGVRAKRSKSGAVSFDVLETEATHTPVRRWPRPWPRRRPLAFDNLSGLPPWLSDTLCRLTSGGAFSTRRLFTDQDEILFALARPVILNGIEDVIIRPDLADRAILLTLAPIAERQRRPERTFWRDSSSHARTS